MQIRYDIWRSLSQVRTGVARDCVCVCVLTVVSSHD